MARKVKGDTNPTRSRRKAMAKTVAVTHTSAPDLPEYAPGGVEWHDQTIEWWEHWVDSPLTAEYLAQDWDDLLDCAIIHHNLWMTGQSRHAVELRHRMARHGYTAVDRAKLGISERQEKDDAPYGYAEVDDE